MARDHDRHRDGAQTELTRAATSKQVRKDDSRGESTQPNSQGTWNGGRMKPLTIAQVQALPATVDLMTAARALGLGRTKAYELVRSDEFPCRVHKIGDTYKVPTADLLALLGMTPSADDSAIATA
jgi:hypothetical protein